MFRSTFSLLKHGVKSATVRSNPKSFRRVNNRLSPFSSSIGGTGDNGGDGGGGRDGVGGRTLGLGFGEKERGNDNDMTFAEAKKLMRLVNVESLKMKLSMEGKETICYSEILDACQSMGITKSVEEAKEFVKVLDEAGVVLLFRDKVYLHPDKVYMLFTLMIRIARFYLLIV